ncbi:MAG: phosphatase PAP2 family protein [Ignavibacteria bacterium]|jgi:undecaprenyl-diphosphatase|nr:phosphatase PAP2 family protein [Ignavibacteria bacterium]
MLDTLLQLDTSIFYFFNHTLSNPVTDFLMPYITDIKTWMPILAVFMIWAVWKGGANGRLCVATLLLAFAFTDPFASKFLKGIFERPRPIHVLPDVNLLVPFSPGKSFPSSHAANSMCVCTVIALFYRRQKYWVPLLAILVGISRPMVGVHYPGDVLFGWIVGALDGILIYLLVTFVYRKFIEPKFRKDVSVVSEENL